MTTILEHSDDDLLKARHCEQLKSVLRIMYIRARLAELQGRTEDAEGLRESAEMLRRATDTEEGK